MSAKISVHINSLAVLFSMVYKILSLEPLFIPGSSE